MDPPKESTANLNVSWKMKKEPLRGGTQTHDRLLATDALLLSYRGGSAGWAESRQYKARATGLTSPETEANSNSTPRSGSR